MPSALTAFSVKIASPGEGGIETVIAREVADQWNALHAWDEKKALLPVRRSESDAPDSTSEGDLLVAFFCAAQGAPTGRTARETDLAIERQLKAGKPALVYFSEGRSGLEGADPEEIRILEEFKRRYPSEALIDSFSNEKELRAKFAQQLEAVMSRHPHLQLDHGACPSPGAVVAEPHPPAPAYSKSAQALLMSACDDPEAYIALMKDSRGVRIQVNGRQFVDPGQPESGPMWEAALHELLAAGLVRDAGYNGQLFQVTSAGFEFLETLGKYPIGYIAELGGM
jgi:hypothetical protein